MPPLSFAAEPARSWSGTGGHIPWKKPLRRLPFRRICAAGGTRCARQAAQAPRHIAALSLEMQKRRVVAHDARQQLRDLFRPKTKRCCVGGQKLHAAVAEFRVRVPHAARQFHELSNVADEKRAMKPSSRLSSSASPIKLLVRTAVRGSMPMESRIKSAP